MQQSQKRAAAPLSCSISLLLPHAPLSLVLTLDPVLAVLSNDPALFQLDAGCTFSAAMQAALQQVLS